MGVGHKVSAAPALSSRSPISWELWPERAKWALLTGALTLLFLYLAAFHPLQFGGAHLQSAPPAVTSAAAIPAARLLLYLVPATLADAGACAEAVRAAAAAAPGAGAPVFAVSAGVRDAFVARLAGAPALVLPVDCPDAEGDAAATCRALAGACAALAGAGAAQFFLVAERAADAWRVGAGAFAANASLPLPTEGLYWGPMRGTNGVPQSLKPAWPRMFWPLMASPYFALSRDVAAALCAMRESDLPLRSMGPPSYWAGVALRTLEGLTYVDSASGREVEAWPAVRAALSPAGAGTAAAPPREKVDIVLVVPNPWPWAERRRAQFNAFLATARRARGAFTAKLIFVMGSESIYGLPVEESPDDAPARAHADVLFLTAPACPDVDGFVPSRWDGQQFPPTNSSTTCKVLEGIAVAVERFEFSYLARVGDDAYFRWDYFLRERAAALPTRGLYLGSVNYKQHVFDHLKPVFGEGDAVLFLPFATYVLLATRLHRALPPKSASQLTQPRPHLQQQQWAGLGAVNGRCAVPCAGLPAQAAAANGRARGCRDCVPFVAVPSEPNSLAGLSRDFREKRQGMQRHVTAGTLHDPAAVGRHRPRHGRACLLNRAHAEIYLSKCFENAYRFGV
jgi:hypothetical protein